MPTKNLPLESQSLIARALGLRMSPKVGKNRNRIAAHVKFDTIKTLRALSLAGLMFEDHAERYGSMRVFRVTPEGAAAIGQKLPAARRFEPLEVIEHREAA